MKQKKGAHAKCSPSSMTRILACPGCVKACEGLPDKTSTYAMEGSIAHHLAETCLINERSAYKYVDYTGVYTSEHKCKIYSTLLKKDVKNPLYQCFVDDDMCSAVQIYLDEIARVREDSLAGAAKVEEQLSLDWLFPTEKESPVWGTADHINIETLGTLHVHDYKHGRGVAVDAENNAQMRAYALMALGERNPKMVEEVTMTIVQPRAQHSAGIIRSESLTAKELIDWGYGVLKPGILAALEKSPERKAGDHCKWCKALATCSVARLETLKAAQIMFTPDIIPAGVIKTLPDPEKFTSDQISKFLDFLGMFKALITAVETEAYDRLQRGRDDAPTNMKLVKGRKKRSWNKTDKEVVESLKNFLPKDKIFAPAKLKTVAQMEKAIKNAGFDKGVLNSSVDVGFGAAVMVSVEDKRSQIKGSANSMFTKEVN